jgi:exopolysaccharide biosynthesis polyprenyl glycosylphosphotransferase
VGKAAKLYERDEHLLAKTTLDEAPALFHVATLYALLVWLGDGLLVEGVLGRGQILGLWGLLFALMLTGRWTARCLVRPLVPAERCLVVGDHETSERIRARFELDSSIHAEVIGRVSFPDESRATGGVPELGTTEALGLVVSEHSIHRVIVAPRDANSEDILHVIRLVKAMGLRVSVLPRLFEVVGSSVEFDNLGGVQLLGLRESGLPLSSRVLKRALDLTGASLGLVLLAPVFTATAIAIKLTSPGSVWFTQPRIGRDGRRFRIYKFRTMVCDAEGRKTYLRHRNQAGEGLFKIDDDPRLTRVGGFLRRTALDELPQLLNVLRGEMSLVGPRPLVPEEDEKIGGWHRSRLELDPGMTGFWQVSGSARVPLAEMVKIDYLYGANWSLWLDVKLLLRTLPYALSRRGM